MAGHDRSPRWLDRKRELLDHAKGRDVLNRRTPARMHGVTLVEISITLAIFALLVALALPGFGNFLANLKIRATAEKLLGGVQLARSEAIKRNQQVDFRVDALQGADWSVLLPDGTSVQSYSGQEGGGTSILVTMVPAVAGNVASFNSLGQRIAPAPAAGPLTYAFSSPGSGDCQPGGPVRCLNVAVSIGGAARMCDPALTDPTNPQAC